MPDFRQISSGSKPYRNTLPIQNMGSRSSIVSKSISMNHPTVLAIHELPLQGWIPRRRMLLSRAIHYVKMNTAKRINRLRNITGVSAWRWNYYDRVTHDETSLNNI